MKFSTAMQPRRFFAALLSIAIAGSFLAGPLEFFVPQAHAAEQLYTCGMHPQIIKKEPGNCPICGMKLTPIRANAAAIPGEKKIKFYKSSMDPMQISDKPGKDSMGMDLVPVYEDTAGGSGNVIQIEPATIQRMNLKTAPVTRGPIRREIRTVGTIAYNEQGLRDITTKYEGWIEKLFVNATWTTVKAGDPLFEIYSPDLYNAQLNYLVAVHTEGNEVGPLRRAARARLRLFDVPPDFAEQLVRADEPQRTFVFRAPADGIVIEKMAVAGQMMKPGERIYRLADLSSVWVLAQIYEQDLPFVRPGQNATVRVTYGPERTLEGKVELVLPQIEEQTRAATARLVLPNADASLRPGMFVEVRFIAELSDSAVLVPDLAVLRSGDHNTVFVARDNGTFEPRDVKLGARTADNRYEVLGGLAEGDRVVTSGQFLLDSESQLREAIQKMQRGDAVVPATSATDHTSASPSAEPTKLLALAMAEADASAALAADDLAGYRRQLPALRAALGAFLDDMPQSPLAKFRDASGEPATLEAARREFEPLSTAIADLAREHHLHHTAGLHVFECPMAPVTGKARWLQRDSGTKNPFFGSAMPNCGEELK